MPERSRSDAGRALGARFSIDGRIALVTGASRGIGSAIAEALAEQGAQVVLSSRKQADLDAEAERINARFPDRAVAIAAHAGKADDLQRLVDEVMARFSRIDILVNNAATNPYFGPVLGAEIGAWDKTFEVNLRGMFLLTKLVYEASMEKQGGAIVNVASVGGLRPGLGLGVYNITKAGVIMLTRQLARELGGTVRVNAVAPGLVKTRFAEALWGNEAILERVLASNPMGRIGLPDEIAGAVAFLVSDAASYINGEVLVIDGGGGEP
ncbi:MAG: glucose 1-dehydrogenase [Candidatus Dormibacteraeota bacterium]|nr:glucose 1-dehydrogenase [Candidatus Dormibacteraeota bacterium]